MNIRHLNSDVLMSKLQELVADDSAIEAELLATIGEVDRRGLYRERAHPNMFRFCVDELHLSESVAGVRITVARAARRFPQLLEKIRCAELHLSGARMLLPFLNEENVEALLAAATHKSRTEIERLLAVRFPKPDVPACVRKLPTKQTTASETIASSPSRRTINAPANTQTTPAVNSPNDAPRVSDPHAALAPLSAERYKIQFTADAKLHAKLVEAQELLGPSVRKGDLATLFSKSLDLLVADLKKRKHGVRTSEATGKTVSKVATSADGQHAPIEEAASHETPTEHRQEEHVSPPSKKRSRYIPRAVRRAVFERDGGQCAYVDARGRRCCERGGLQYHHRIPFGRGGDSTAANLELRCSGHNILAAEQEYGTALIEKRRARSRSRDGVQKREANAAPV